MVETVNLGSVKAEVLRKRIKHMHLGVFPPEGAVRISAPEDVALDTIRVFAISKLAWIKQQQRKMKAQPREPEREYINRESHYVWDGAMCCKFKSCQRPPVLRFLAKICV